MRSISSIRCCNNGSKLAPWWQSRCFDVPILVMEMHFKKKQLGIDDEFLSHQSSVIGWNVEELIQQVN